MGSNAKPMSPKRLSNQSAAARRLIRRIGIA